MKNMSFFKHLAIVGLICHGASITAYENNFESRWRDLEISSLRRDLDALQRKNQFGFLGSLEAAGTICSMVFLYYLMFPSSGDAGISLGNTTIPTTTFDDVIGAQEAKEALGDIVEILKNPEKYAGIGARLPKGILLEGAPGNGKTLLAKALAGEAKISFFATSGSSFTDKYTGIGINRVKALFEYARKNAPCIIFIDEIDGIGKRVADWGAGGQAENNRVLTEFLTQMDGIQTDPKKPVIVIAATNHKELVDPAMLRSGRFDAIVRVEHPTEADRKTIIQLYANKIKTDTAIDFDMLARATIDFSGADLENIVNQAALIAVRRKSVMVEQTDFDKALNQLKETKIKNKPAQV